jgi:hypothetical protein
LFLDKYSITGLKTMSTFANVYVGAAANDGTGDPLRNAFQKINTNFANIGTGATGGGVTSVAGRSGNVVLTINDVYGAASVAYVDNQIANSGSANLVNGSYTLNLGTTGVLTFPNGDTNINKQRYGMGNLVAYLDGEWTLGEYNGSDYGTAGIRICPGIEGSSDLVLPSNSNAATTPVQLSNYAGNVLVRATSQQWTFNSTGNLVLPTAGNIVFGDGTYQNTTSAVDWSQPVHITNTSPTTDRYVGALVVDGGASVNGNMFVDLVLHIGDDSFTTGLSNPTVVATGGGAQYAQMAMKNISSTGSADIAAYGDNGGDLGGWVDMGICGSGFNDSNYTITKSNDGYLFTQASNNSFGGNLVLATGNQGSYNDIVIAQGGFHDHDEVARFHGNTTSNGTFTVQTRFFANAGINTTANVTAANITLRGNTGFPTNTTTIRGWARINVGGAAFWTPLYQ